MKAASAWFRSTGCTDRAGIGVVVLAMVALATSRASAQKKEPPPGTIKQSTYAALADAPEKARERKNPFAGDPQAVAAGGKLFEQHCAECHGMKAGGTRKGPTLLGEEVQQATPGTLFWILSNGVVRRGMPVWSKLPEQQRWQIVTFLQSLKVQTMSSQP
jgi:mono/diheme cytochrome c family protein